MSTEFEFHCRTCNAQLRICPNGRDTSYYDVPALQQVVKAKRELAGLAHRGFDELFNSPFSTVCEWMERHVDHDVVVRDEYGRDADHPCTKHERCSHCNGYIRCGLQDGHEPPCREA